MAAPGTPSKSPPATAALDTFTASTSRPASRAGRSSNEVAPAAPEVPAPPPPPPLHAAAQAGDVEAIHRLLTTNEATAQDRDASNITPLHWSAINNHVLACKELLAQGAEVDAIGGDLLATPMQWAARNGHLAVVHLLILHGADPAATDSQGFDTFHLATHSSSPLLLAYLLSQQLPVATDATDRAGRTCLQWACYQGDGLSVDLLLKFGANANRPDPGGLTALHWAVVKGNVGCIAKVVEAGGDIWAKNAQGQTPLDLAKQLNSVAAWDRAMAQLGRESDGRLRSRPLSERNSRVAIFALPCLLLFLVFTTVNILPWFTGVPLALAEFYGMHHVVTRVLLDVRPRPGAVRAFSLLFFETAHAYRIGHGRPRHQVAVYVRPRIRLGRCRRLRLGDESRP
jgi:palmitoyltransferase